MRQLDTLFFIFINDSALEIKSDNYGVNINNEKPQYYDYMLMLLYYYDIIIIFYESNGEYWLWLVHEIV